MDDDTDAAAPAPAPASAPAAPAPTVTGISKPAEPRRRNRPALSCIQCRTRKIRCDRNEPCASCTKSKIVNCTYEEARRPKPRLWKLSPAPTASRAEQSPTTSDERLPFGPGFTFRVPPVPPALPASNRPSAAAAHGRSPESSSAANPLAQPQSLGAAPGSSTPSPADAAALAERVRQLEQQLADALKRADQPTPSSSSARESLALDHAAPSRPCGANILTDGDKLVGGPRPIRPALPYRDVTAAVGRLFFQAVNLLFFFPFS